MTIRTMPIVTITTKHTVDLEVTFTQQYQSPDTEKYDDLLDTLHQYYKEFGYFPKEGALLYSNVKQLYYTVHAVQYIPRNQSREHSTIRFIMTF